MEDDIGTITEALAKKIQEVFGPLLPSAEINKDILFAPEDIALRQRGEATSGRDKPLQQDRTKYTLEFLSFWLEDAQFSWERNRTPMSRTGLQVGGPGASQFRTVKAVPFDLEFSITMWTLQRKVANNFIKQYGFLQLNNPVLSIFWGTDIPLVYQFFIRPSVPRNDTVSKMYVEGKYWKPQVGFKVEAWLYEDVPIGYVDEVDLKMWTQPDSVPLGSPIITTEVINEVIK